MDGFETKKKYRIKKPIYICICVFCLLLGVLGGYLVGHHQMSSQVAGRSLYDEIAELVEENFLAVNDQQESNEEMMVKGMLSGLGDEYTGYYKTSDWNETRQSINGSFQGIGCSFVKVNGGILLLDVFDGSPAQKAGLLKGDVITHVAGTAIDSYATDKIKEAIVGEVGTKVTLRVISQGKVKDVECTRAQIESSVAYEVRQSGDVVFGYLRITTFGESTAKLVETALQEFEKQNVKSLIIDLRDNSGGDLDAAKGILNLFVPKGKVLYSVQDNQGHTFTTKADDGKKYTFEKGLILTNGGSASASEVLIAGLKENLAYQTVGEKTFGKGITQSVIPLSNGDYIKVTHTKWLTPEGHWIHKNGIEADWEVDLKTLSDYSLPFLEESYQYDQVHGNVTCLQKILKELGYDIDREDGYFSRQTQTAWKAFEKKYGLKENGVFEKADVPYLLSVFANHMYYGVEDSQYLKAIEFIK